MSDFDTPTLACLDGTSGGRYVVVREAVVIGPGRAILFYGRCSMGEGLKVDEARDAAFLLTGAGMWVGKLA